MSSSFAEVVATIFVVVTTGAGILMMILGYRLTQQRSNLLGMKQTINERAQVATDVVKEAHNVIQQRGAHAVPEVQLHQAGEGGNTPQVQVATQQLAGQAIGGTAEYVKGLAELVKNLSGLTPAVLAFVVATILFVIAGSVVTVMLFRI